MQKEKCRINGAEWAAKTMSIKEEIAKLMRDATEGQLKAEVFREDPKIVVKRTEYVERLKRKLNTKQGDNNAC